MKLLSSKALWAGCLAALTLGANHGGVAGVEGKYFSEGWQPGQETTPAAAAGGAQATAYAVGGSRHQANLHVSGDDNLGNGAAKQVVQQRPQRPSLKNALSDTLTKLSGGRVNVTHILELVDKQEQFDRTNDTMEGFTRLTDDNFEEMVQYERFPLTGGVSEEDRVWFILVHGPPRDPASQFFYEAVTNASILTKEAGDLKHVRFARLDFMTEPKLCAKWLIFRPPYIVIATNRGADLRFLHYRAIRPEGEIIRRILQEEVWKEFPIWESQYGPGGSRAWVMDAYIWVTGLWGRLTSRMPSWMFLIFSGLFTQTILQFLHRNKGSAATPEQQKLAEISKEVKDKAAASASASGQLDASSVGESTAVQSSTPSKASQRKKGGKKVSKVVSSGSDDVTVTVETK